MKINATEIRVGMILEYKNDLWEVLKTNHVKPGKGGAFAQVEMKSLNKNTKLNERFRSSETVERVILEEKKATYLYEDSDKLVFMDAISFEQKFLLKELIGEKSELLEDGMEVILNSFNDEVISVDLPDTIVVEILEADAVVKGQTASSSYKPAKIKNEIRILVPPHIETGTKVVIKTEDRSYVERSKE